MLIFKLEVSVTLHSDLQFKKNSSHLLTVSWFLYAMQNLTFIFRKFSVSGPWSPNLVLFYMLPAFLSAFTLSTILRRVWRLDIKGHHTAVWPTEPSKVSQGWKWYLKKKPENSQQLIFTTDTWNRVNKWTTGSLMSSEQVWDQNSALTIDYLKDGNSHWRNAFGALRWMLSILKITHDKPGVDVSEKPRDTHMGYFFQFKISGILLFFFFLSRLNFVLLSVLANKIASSALGKAWSIAHCRPLEILQVQGPAPVDFEIFSIDSTNHGWRLKNKIN